MVSGNKSGMEGWGGGQGRGAHDQLNVIEVSNKDTHTYRFTAMGFTDGQFAPDPSSLP